MGNKPGTPLPTEYDAIVKKYSSVMIDAKKITKQVWPDPSPAAVPPPTKPTVEIPAPKITIPPPPKLNVHVLQGGEAVNKAAVAQKEWGLRVLTVAGSNSYIIKAKYNNEDVICKEWHISKGMHDQAALDNFAKECQMLVTLNSPYVAKCYGAYWDTVKFASFSGLGESGYAVGLVIKYYPGSDLESCGAKGYLNQFSLAAKLKIAHDVAAGLEHMHSKMVYHRDFKPGQVLLNCDPTNMYKWTPKDAKDNEPLAVITDFGSSITLKELVQLKTPHHPDYTQNFCPPERLLLQKGESKDYSAVKTDVWGFGWVLFVLYAPVEYYNYLLDLESQKWPNTAGPDEPCQKAAQLNGMPDPFRAVMMNCFKIPALTRPDMNSLLGIFK